MTFQSVFHAADSIYMDIGSLGQNNLFIDKPIDHVYSTLNSTDAAIKSDYSLNSQQLQAYIRLKHIYSIRKSHQDDCRVLALEMILHTHPGNGFLYFAKHPSFTESIENNTRSFFKILELISLTFNNRTDSAAVELVKHTRFAPIKWQKDFFHNVRRIKSFLKIELDEEPDFDLYLNSSEEFVLLMANNATSQNNYLIAPMSSNQNNLKLISQSFLKFQNGLQRERLAIAALPDIHKSTIKPTTL